MSTAIEDARQQLVDERLPELEELINHRNECLQEMWEYMTYGKDNGDELTLDEEDTNAGGLDGFLERFDLVKNRQSGSIHNFEIPDLKLRTESSPTTPASAGEAELFEAAPEPERDEEKHEDTEEEEFLYPESSPLTVRPRRRLIVDEEEDEEDDNENEASSNGMDVDMADNADEKPSEPVQFEQEEQEGEPIADVEDEAVASKKEVVLRTPPRTRSSSPVMPRRRKRRRSQISDEEDSDEDIKRLSSVADDDRQIRSKSRKVNGPPATSPVPDEDDERDELDIISLPSSSNIAPSGKPISKRTDLLLQVVSETIASQEDTGGDEHNDVLEDEDEEEGRPPEPTDPAKLDNESRFVPASPSTPSVRSLSKSLSISPIPEPRPPLKSPPRLVTKPLPFYVPDNTPLTPPKSPPPPIIVQLPVSQVEKPVYRFNDELMTLLNGEVSIKYEDTNTQPAGSSRPTPSSKQFDKPAMKYTLPPLSALPAEFSRKGKPQKSRKRDKEREKGSSDSGKKDDWVPLGMTKWAAILQANAAYKKLSRASKCVSTKDWNTAATELKLIRTFDRINTLKSTGKWSFRQLKKQRVAAGLVKTHWDYLMDEMKWLQVDFREERRWKIALAYEIALSVREWHEASSSEERVRLGICAAWRKPDMLEDLPVNDSDGMEVDIVPAPEPKDEEPEDDTPMEKQHVKKSLVDFYSSENEEDDMEDQQAVNDALIPDNVNADPPDDSQQPFTVPDVVEVPSITMKLEEVEGDDVLHPDEGENYEEDILNFHPLPPNTDVKWQDSAKAEAMDPSQALKKTSNNPIVDAQLGASTSGPEPMQKEQRNLWTADQAKVIRSSLLSLPEETLFFTMDEFVPISDEDLMKSLVPEGGPVDMSSAFDISIVFPELQPFSMIDVANSDIVGGSFDGKKKGDRKVDKDDPTKRTEETTYMKLCPTNKFMHVKPTLVSALQPSKKWRKGKWVDLDESPVVSDVDGPAVVTGAENTCSLFEGRKISIPFLPPLTLQNFSKIPRSNTRSAEIPWSQAEENAMKMLTDRYPSNWRLVADALNSSRIRTSIDLRTPQECFEKWRSKFGLPSRPVLPLGMHTATPFIGYEESPTSHHIAADTPPPQTPSMPATTPQMTTRGVKRLATSAAQNALNLTVNTGIGTVEARKRKRHFIIYEAVRKTIAKRQKNRKQDEAKNQISSSALAPVHDTHVQYGSTKRYTPLELSAMKTEKEKKDNEMLRMRNREIELKRQEARQYQAQIQQQMSQQGVAGQQNVPQIRTQVGISQHQQQKLPTQVGSIPLSPQMMQQAQAAQQARALAQAQSQVQQQQQTQPNHPQMQGQMGNVQAGMNGTSPHHSAPYANHGGATSPVAQHSSPPRSSATPVNSMANFPRPSSAQRNVQMPGGQVMPMANGQVPIARTNNALAAYFANTGTVQYTPEQMSQLLRYQQAQQAQQAQQSMQLQLQQQQQQQQSMQASVQQGQQNLGINGYPPTMQ